LSGGNRIVTRSDSDDIDAPRPLDFCLTFV